MTCPSGNKLALTKGLLQLDHPVSKIKYEVIFETISIYLSISILWSVATHHYTACIQIFSVP